MNPQSALNQYKKINIQSAVESASPHRLVQLLMEGALQRMAEAKGAMERKNIAQKGEAIGKAISIIGGLRDSLAHEVKSDLPQKLDNLYLYVTKRLLEVNRNNDVKGLDELIQTIRTVKEGWDGIADPSTREKSIH